MRERLFCMQKVCSSVPGICRRGWETLPARVPGEPLPGQAEDPEAASVGRGPIHSPGHATGSLRILSLRVFAPIQATRLPRICACYTRGIEHALAPRRLPRAPNPLLEHYPSCWPLPCLAAANSTDGERDASFSVPCVSVPISCQIISREDLEAFSTLCILEEASLLFPGCSQLLPCQFPPDAFERGEQKALPPKLLPCLSFMWTQALEANVG